jgi:hypothetical protein
MTVCIDYIATYKSLNWSVGYESGLSDTTADLSGNAPFLRQLEHQPATPPAATSTPQRSVQSPSQLQFQSNLLEQDSDMQKAMKDLNSFDEDSSPNIRPCEVFCF